jgi:hypothetical protein
MSKGKDDYLAMQNSYYDEYASQWSLSFRDPVVGSYSPGQWCSIIVDDEFVRMRLESDFEPRKDVLLRRIMSITVNIPESSTFPEQVSLDLVPELEVNGFAQ